MYGRDNVLAKLIVVNLHLNAGPLWHQVLRRFTEIVYEKRFISARMPVRRENISNSSNFLFPEEGENIPSFYFFRKDVTLDTWLIVYIFMLFPKLIFVREFTSLIVWHEVIIGRLFIDFEYVCPNLTNILFQRSLNSFFSLL